MKRETVRGGSAVAFLSCNDVCFRIDVEQTFAHHIHFRSPNGGVQCRQLTVDVGGIYTIGVYERQVPYPTAHQRFGTPRAYAANAEDRYTGMPQAFQSISAHEGFGARLPIHIHCTLITTRKPKL